MKYKHQEVELYYDPCEAMTDMKRHIKEDWLVHTCAMCGDVHSKRILVVYEKDMESWS